MKLAISEKNLKKFEPLQCSDCQSREALEGCYDPEKCEIILCRSCKNERLEEFSADEGEDFETHEEYVRNDHLAHWRKEA